MGKYVIDTLIPFSEHHMLGKVKIVFLYTGEKLIRDLECELKALAISVQLFLQILTKIFQIENIVKHNKELHNIIAVLSAYTQKELGFMCVS